MPQVHVGCRDTIRYIFRSIWHDLSVARQMGAALPRLLEILQYRFAQYTGSYRGNHEHRRLSHAEKDHYFYPSHPLERL